MSNDIITVAKYQFEHEAELARALLEAEGIMSHISADNAGGAIPALQVLFPVRILVRAEDAERAREILADPGDYIASEEEQ